jgi:hypothetical protein
MLFFLVLSLHRRSKNQDGIGLASEQSYSNRALALAFRIDQAEDSRSNLAQRQKQWLAFHTHVMVCYTVSLHGCEGFLLAVTGLNQKFAMGGTKYVVIASLPCMDR